jgi:hypothetical protein
MSLNHGRLLDLAAPLIEVTTHWDGEGWMDPHTPGQVPGAWELGAAEHRDDAVVRQNLFAMRHYHEDGPSGPLGQAEATVTAGELELTVPVLTYRHYQAFRFQSGRVVVTVVCRHLPPGLMLRFEPVTDFEPYILGSVAQHRQTEKWQVRP